MGDQKTSESATAAPKRSRWKVVLIAVVGVFLGLVAIAAIVDPAKDKNKEAAPGSATVSSPPSSSPTPTSSTESAPPSSAASSSATSERQWPGGRPAGLVERESWTDGAWPFTTDYATLMCNGDGNQKWVTVTANREMYALNGAAKSADLWPAFDPIWADDPATPGLKVNVGPMIQRGLALCQN